MWRSLFLALGAYLCLLGLQCLGVEKAVLTLRKPPSAQSTTAGSAEPKLGPPREMVPPDWAPWSLMATGAVVCLYSFTIPQRIHSR